MTPELCTARLPSGLVLPYAESGSPEGDAVAFLHAYADSWRSFERVLPELPRTIRAVAPSQRGHGDASKPPDGYAVEDFAADALAFIDALGLEEVVLVASSSAVFTAELLAVAHPERVRGLVFGGVPWSIAERAPSLDFLEIVEGLADPVDPAFVRVFIESTTSDRVPPDFLDAMVNESAKLTADVWKQTLAGLFEAEPPEHGAIRAPTLVVWGDRDELIPRSDQERLVAAIPGSRLVAYPDAGHVVHWEEPERFARDVAAFVTSLAR